MGLCALNGRRLARTELFIYLYKCAVDIDRCVLLKGRGHSLVLAEQLIYFEIGGFAEGTHKGAYRQLAVFVYTDIKRTVRCSLVLEPCAAVRYDG